MNKKDIVAILETLKSTYPDAKCSLDFNSPFELVVSVILSAQCTDARVNKVTPNIFCNFSTPEDFSKIDLSLLEDLIHSCGFYKNKAKNIKLCANKIVNEFNGIVPNTLEQLLTLPGIGRKSANVIMLEVFNTPVGIAIDTHAKRISTKIGLSKKSIPDEIEQDLIKQIPREYFKDVNHLFMWHGRNICTAPNPKCDICPIKKLCNNFINNCT